MEEEDEDQALLSTLGVTSANPEDIERGIIEQASDAAGDCNGSGTSAKEAHLKGSEIANLSSGSSADLYNKLRAVEVEIDAVASALEHFARTEEQDNSDGRIQQADEERDQGAGQASSTGSSLQQALAADRLESLMKTKAQLEKEISDPLKANRSDKVIRDLVREKPKAKQRVNESLELGRKQNKRLKTVAFDDDNDFDEVLNAASCGFIETEKDELIRKGVLTPFHKLRGFERRIQESPPAVRMSPSEGENENDNIVSTSMSKALQRISEAAQARPTTKLLSPESLPKLDPPTRPFQRLRTPFKFPRSKDDEPGKNKDVCRRNRRPRPGKRWRKLASRDEIREEEYDVGVSSNEDSHQEVVDHEDEEPPYITLEGGLRIPEGIFCKLFDYQKVGVQWLWELHCQRAGGIIGDEMGLGKTIQVLAFLGSLHFSGLYKPSIIICPVTLLRQWKREAQKWYPAFHAEILHDSAQNAGGKEKYAKSDDSDYESGASEDSGTERKLSSRNSKKWDSLVDRVLRSEAGLLITTYEQLRLLGESLLDIEWGYAVLDEGHRIRNPNAEITLACKQLQTVHRIIMTGAPIQNKLSELWSLFDFVFPGKLGVLPVFEAEFAVPISVGGYANATPLQVSTAYRCAVVLRDLIMPYLLRRMKADVNAQLPKKTEHVLFCSLTPEQRSVYRAFLASSEVEQIFDGSKNSLYGIDVMRKICNHPDLLEREHSSKNPDYGNPVRSGKMKVVDEVLKVWKDQGHRVLLFTQTQQMLDILQSFLIASGYNYRRMDGLTPVKQRMALIDEFNNSDEVFIFILTTKVGGLGTNLTGANRVIIFDPDWNPSTDMQARERAWRIGQTKDVTVFRLITRGTIEEKVYHRQIYKHFLTNKILKNPQQRRFFKARDLKDLFTLNDEGERSSTETSTIFSQLSEVVNVVGADENHGKRMECHQAVARSSDGSNTDDDQNNEGSKEKGKERADDGRQELDEETRMLRSLFDAQGIHSALNHDAIMDAHDDEKLKLEEQASQVAKKAAEALRQSRMLRSRESITIPTWTGRSGAAGAPPSVKRKFGSTVNPQLASSRSSEDLCNSEASRQNQFAAGAAAGKAMSSAELLARIRGNQERAVSHGLEQQFGLASSSSSRTRSMDDRPPRSLQNAIVQPEVLIRQICTFIQRKGGTTDSASIVEHFRDRIPAKDLPLFKSLLKEIATLEKNPSGSFWVLKPDYLEG